MYDLFCCDLAAKLGSQLMEETCFLALLISRFKGFWNKRENYLCFCKVGFILDIWLESLGMVFEGKSQDEDFLRSYQVLGSFIDIHFKSA